MTPLPRPKVFRRRFPLQRKSVRTPPSRWRDQAPVIEVELERGYSILFPDEKVYKIAPLLEALNLPPSNQLVAWRDLSNLAHDLQKLPAACPGCKLEFLTSNFRGDYIRITRPARIPAKLSPKLRRALGWETSPSQ